MKILESIEVDNYSVAEANWLGLGTEYNSSSFYPIKEFLDNSFSAAHSNKLCNVKIMLTELEGGEVLVEIEDDATGISDVNVLLSIGSLSSQKNGLHNQYGYGIKNALAFFQTDWVKSDWIIQSKTEEFMFQGKCIQVRGPYFYPHETNNFYNHKGIDATVIGIDGFMGKMTDRSGTYIKFKTPLPTFVRMSPFEKSGRPIVNLAPAAKQLSQLISQWYSPKIKSGKIRVEIDYKCLTHDKYTTLIAEYEEYPIYETLKVVEGAVKTSKGGELNIKAKWFGVDRYNTNFLIPPKHGGVVCYVNGVLVDPFIWIDEVFGHKWNGEISSLVCLVEVESKKIDCPEISVSKTKFVQTGSNFENLINFLQKNCPRTEISKYKKRNSVQSEKAKIGQFTDMVNNNPLYDGLAPETEVPIELNNKILAGNDCRYDIVQTNHGNIKIMEFKKGEINPAAVYQANTYYDLAQIQYEGNIIQMVLAGETINLNAKKIIEALRNDLGKDIIFKSFADLGLPK